MYARILPPDVTRSVAGGASAELDGMDVATDNARASYEVARCQTSQTL
jgi:hypothetical protein